MGDRTPGPGVSQVDDPQPLTRRAGDGTHLEATMTDDARPVHHPVAGRRHDVQRSALGRRQLLEGSGER